MFKDMKTTKSNNNNAQTKRNGDANFSKLKEKKSPDYHLLILNFLRLNGC